MNKIKRWFYRLLLALVTTLFVVSPSFTSYAHYGTGVISVDGNNIWMGWSHFESGTQGYSSAASDGGHAYGRYQFDIGYDFVDFISLCLERYPDHYDGFKYYISISNITKGRGSSSSTTENKPLLDARAELSAYWQQCCDQYGEEFYTLQDEYMYQHYFLAAKNNLKAQGIDLDKYNDARINGTVWSIAVRDSAGTNSIKKALINTYYDGISADDWLNAIYTAETQKHPSQKKRWDQEQRAACFALTDFGGEGGGTYTTGADSTKSTGIFSFFEKIFDFWSKFSASLQNFVKRFFNMPAKSWFEGSTENAKITDTTISAQSLMEIIDEAAEKAYAGQYEKLYQQTQSDGLDYSLTANSFSTKGNSLKDLDYAYIMSVYSLSTNMYETTLEQFKKDMEDAMEEMSSYTLETKTTQTITKVPVYKYRKVTVDTCDEYDVQKEVEYEDSEGNSCTRTIEYTMHSCDPKDYYLIEKDQYGNPVVEAWITSENGKVVTDYQPIAVKIGEYHDEETELGVHCGTYYPDEKKDDFGNPLNVYYTIGPGDGHSGDGKRTDMPIFNTVTYGEASSTSKSSGDLFKAFATVAKKKDPNLDIDPETFKNDKYIETQYKILKPDEGSDESWYELTRYDDEIHSDTEITNFEMAQFRYQRFSALYGTAKTTQETTYKKGLTEQEIKNYLKSLPEGISGNRKQIIKTALSLVHQVPYCNNGENSKPRQVGYDPTWYDYTRCDSLGRPSGLDSSGYIQWVFWTAGFSRTDTEVLRHTSSISNSLTELVKKEDIQPGDIGLVQLGITDDSNESYNRVGIYLGSGEWIVNSSTDGTVIISSSENFSSIKVFSDRMEDDDLYNDEIIFYGTGSAELGGTLYSICRVIAGECGGTSNNAIAAYAELIKNRALDTTEFANVSTAWDVISKCGDFVTYENGTYEQVTPNSKHLDLVQQVFDAKFAVLNNAHVYYAAPQKDHIANYQKGKSYKFDSYDVFKTVDAEIYYVESKYHMSDAGLLQYNSTSTSSVGSGDAAKVGQIPNNGGSMPIVYYQQSGGQPWSSLPFGDHDIANSGCSITSLAMVVSYLKGGTNSSLWQSPGDIREMIIQKTGNYNHFKASGGQSWDIMPAVARYYGIGCSQISSASIVSALRQGKPVIMSCVPGEFTKKGHFIVLTGLTADGHIVVNDPSHPDKSGKLYTEAFIISQGKGWWAFG